MLNFLILFFAATAQADFINLKVNRNLDLSQAIVRSKTSITIENTGKAVQANYEIPLQFPVEFSAVKINKKAVETRVKNNKILVPVNLKPDGTVTLELTLVFTSGVEPLPKKVAQFDKQALLYKGDVGFFSPYLTKEVVTVVKLPNSNELVSKLNGPEPFTRKGKEITFGPWLDVEKSSTKDVKIHFYSTKSLLSASKIVKIVQVSQLGSSMNFLEYYTLHHKGAE